MGEQVLQAFRSVKNLKFMHIQSLPNLITGSLTVVICILYGVRTISDRYVNPERVMKSMRLDI